MARKISSERRSYREGGTSPRRDVRAASDSPFAILGVPRDASSAQVKRAYRRLAARRHPDAESRHRGAETGLAPGEREVSFHEIQQAYRTLQDRYARARWEREEEERERRSARDAAETRGRTESRETASAEVEGDGRGRAGGGIVISVLEEALRPWRWKISPREWGRRLLLAGVLLPPALLFLSRSDGPPVRRDADAAGKTEASAAARERTLVQRHPEAHGARLNATARVSRSRLGGPRLGGMERGWNIQETRAPDTNDPAYCANGCETAVRNRHAAPPLDLDNSGQPVTPATAAGATVTGASATGVTVTVAPVTGATVTDTTGAAGAAAQSSPMEPRATGEREAREEPRTRAPSRTDEWCGTWVAYCFGSGGTDLYRASLEVGERARFHWLNLRTGLTGGIGGLEAIGEAIGAENGRKKIVLRAARESYASSRAGYRDSGRLWAELDRDGPESRLLRWREDGRSRGALEAVPCVEWWIAPRAGETTGDDPPDGSWPDGLWVLPSGGRVAEGSYLAEYAELRIARKGNHLDGGFAGRYAVPAGMAREVRFAFQVASVTGWHAWRNDRGVEGDVLLAPLGPSRLGVIWRRRTIPGGRPQLSGGVQVLWRMD